MNTKFKITFSIILFCLLPSLVFTELLENDLRLASLKNEKKNESTRKLKFQSQYGNFLIFYDYAGSIIYIKHKRDKWDYSNDKAVSFLRQGYSYNVSFNYIDAVFHAPDKDTIELDLKKLKTRLNVNTSKITRKDKQVYLGKFIGYKSDVLNRLRY